MLTMYNSNCAQLTTATDLQEIRALVAPWRDIVDRIKNWYNTNCKHPSAPRH